MDSETRAAFAAQSETMSAGFARIDRYFELQQAQFMEWRDELRGGIRELGERVDALSERVDALSERVDGLSERVVGLEHEFGLLRDYVTREIAEIRRELRELRGRSGQKGELRREINELAVRVERLERRSEEQR